MQPGHKENRLQMEKGPINASPAGATATDGEKCCLPTKYVSQKNKSKKKKGVRGGSHDTLSALFAGRMSDFLTISNKVDHRLSESVGKEHFVPGHN